MCYSAECKQQYNAYVEDFGANISLRDFYQLYLKRQQLPLMKIAKGMDANFEHPKNDKERAIHSLIAQYNAAQAAKMEQDLFAQRKRLADAERILLTKTTTKAENDQRIATDKIARLRGKLADLTRTDSKPRDNRIFPGHYAPVMIWENGGPVVKPMRYQCRPAGKPVIYDIKYPGLYNARRDNLEKFWKGQFGHTHGIMIVDTFYENVSRHAMEGRELGPDEKEQNVVLQFKPNPPHQMLVACLWSHWTAPGEDDLLSFAAITDEPPAEVAAAGHDRCIVPIKPDHVTEWLQPNGDLVRYQALLEDRDRPYYQHRLAA